MYARPLIDSLEFARHGQQLNGEIPVAALPRLVEVLSQPYGMLHYTIQGGVDEQSVSWLDIEVTGACELLCQRCLEGMAHPVQLSTRLLLRDQASLDVLEDDEEAFDSILAQAHLDVIDLIEEEILLSLPIAPKHEFGQCQAVAGNAAQQDRVNPFAVLEQLKHH